MRIKDPELLFYRNPCSMTLLDNVFNFLYIARSTHRKNDKTKNSRALIGQLYTVESFLESLEPPLAKKKVLSENTVGEEKINVRNRCGYNFFCGVQV